jgi:uncharacterized YccA/Bax inhibitor family protein
MDWMNLFLAIGALVFLFFLLTANTGTQAKEDRSFKIIMTIVCVGLAIWGFLTL